MYVINKFAAVATVIVLGGMALFLGALGAPSPAKAATILSDTFDTAPTLSSTEAPGVWYTDRYPPAGFTSVVFDGGNRLGLTLSATDAQPSFYNTQGRKYDTAGANYMSVSMYIDSSWASDPGRIGGMWSTGFDATNTISAYPIIEFVGGQFEAWDFNAGVWIPMGLPSGFTTDQWYTLAFVLDTVNNLIDYTVNGQLLTTVSANGTTQLGNVMLQGVNTTPGVNRTLYFDNLLVSQTPLPATLPLFASGLGALGLLGWRRKRKNTAALAA